jgi:predicted DNA-binding transcriptional regulator AlpA
VSTDERRSGSVPTHLKLALSVPEIAEMVGLSQASVRRLVTEGVLPTVPHTGRGRAVGEQRRRGGVMIAVVVAFGALLWPAALLLFMAHRDEVNPGGWCSNLYGALDRGLFGGRP